ncbi:MAG: hypothetical protein LN417_10050 [Candidatus Thermoplasmatota archaeon]|nr:hypothetical protein [Candidatus Thermoplasmatota archaeon]
MDIPNDEYTLESFIQYLAQNLDSVLDEEDFRREMKVYFLLTSDNNWERHFRDYAVEPLGDFARIRMPYRLSEGSHQQEALYFARLHEDGVLMLFTSAIRDVYKETVQKLADSNRGIMGMWIRPLAFDGIREHILDRYRYTQIKHFISRRCKHDRTACKVGRDRERWIEYRGNDGTETLKELRDAYGVRPTEVDYYVSDRVRLNCYSDGRFVLRTINEETFALFLELTNLIMEDIRRMRLVATSIEFRIETIPSDMGDLRVPTVEAAEIQFPSANLNVAAVEELRSSQDEFSFMGVSLDEGSLAFSATVKDETKQSVFDLSATENTIRLVPKYDTTFESFIRFFKLVTESIDEDATLSRFSELHG